MKKLLLAPSLAAALVLPGCAGTTLRDFAGPAIGVVGAILGARTATQASVIALDAAKLNTANRFARSVFNNVTLAGRANQIAPSNDDDTARANFCELVVADLATVTDEGGRTMRLICLVQHHLNRAEAALEARDPVAYAEHLAKADTFTDQLQAIVTTSMTRGATP